MVKTPPKKVFWGGFGGLNPFSGGTWTLRVCLFLARGGGGGILLWCFLGLFFLECFDLSGVSQRSFSLEKMSG